MSVSQHLLDHIRMGQAAQNVPALISASAAVTR